MNEPFAPQARPTRDREREATLLRRIAERDSAALAELYDSYSGLLLALSRRVLKSQEEAEDVLQEVFVQVWKQAGRYDARRSSVSTWLSLIARSRSIDRLRTRQVQDRTATAAFEEDPRTDTSPKGATNVLDRERRERLLQELSALPNEQREVLNLAFYEGLTQSEIALATGIPLGTVKTRTLLAMKKLRKALGDEVEQLL